MDRQTLRDWVIRYNEHGVAGLCDRWNGGRPPLLDAQTSRPSCSPSCWPGPIRRRTASALSRARTWWLIAEKRFGKSMHPTSMGRLLRRLGPVATEGAAQPPDEGPGRRSGL